MKEGLGLGYLLLVMVTVTWSFVGVLVKASSLWVDSSIISFFRFFFGVIFLGIFLLIKYKRIGLWFNYKWIWIGAAGKAINYIFENLGISMGHVYAQVLVSPVYVAFSVFVAAFYFKEKIAKKGWIGVVICAGGVCLVSWNGMPLSELLSTNSVVTLLFIFSGIGAGIHFLSQKILLESVESGEMNFSMFMLSTLFTAIPLPFTAHYSDSFNPLSLVALIVLGAITGISFYIYVKALKKVPFIIAIMISNSGVILSMIWAKLFFDDPITHIAIAGTIVFLSGIILLNIPKDLSIQKLFQATIKLEDKV